MHEYTVVKDGYFSALKDVTGNEEAVELRLYESWYDNVVNDLDSRDIEKNTVKYFPEGYSVRKVDAGWFFNCLGAHDGVTKAFEPIDPVFNISYNSGDVRLV